MDDKQTQIYDVIIAGSGPAGLTAAIYAARSNLKVLVVAGREPGGQLIWTTDVEDYPGFPEGIQGPDLVLLFRKQAERLGAEFLDGEINSTDLKNQPFKVTVGQKDYVGKAIIVATGSSAMWLGLESEQRLRGHGVSACAVCDGAFFKGKNLVVVGGGDTALKDALFLTKFAPKVYVVHRRDTLKAFPQTQEKAFANDKIEFIWNSEVTDVVGENKVESVKIKNNQTGAQTSLDAQGLFVAIGHKPNTDFLKGQLDLDSKGYIIIQEGSKTTIPGVFAAGDVHDYKYQQAVTAAGAGCMAALEVEDFLQEQKS